jgi:hypothetical protein
VLTEGRAWEGTPGREVVGRADESGSGGEGTVGEVVGLGKDWPSRGVAVSEGGDMVSVGPVGGPQSGGPDGVGDYKAEQARCAIRQRRPVESARWDATKWEGKCDRTRARAGIETGVAQVKETKQQQRGIASGDGARSHRR